MANIEKAVIARIKFGNQNFEVLVDCEKAMKFKHGELADVRPALAVEEVYTDAKKGTKASEETLQKNFGTANRIEIAAKIIKKGDVQLTAEYRAKLREQKRRQIIHIIHKNAIDPRTKLPHPITRIEAALEEAKIKIDEFKEAEQQIERIVRALQPIIPIKFATTKIAVKIPALYIAKGYSMLRDFGTLEKEEWQNDGSWIGIFKLPAGLKQDFFNKINALTKGEAETKELDSEG